MGFRREEMGLPNDVALERMLTDDDLDAADDMDACPWCGLRSCRCDDDFDADRDKRL